MFVVADEKTKDSELHGSKHCRNLVCLFVVLRIPNYCLLKTVTFSILTIGKLVITISDTHFAVRCVEETK
jgi:hypothetical protein